MCFCSLCGRGVRYGVFVRCVVEVVRYGVFVRCVVEAVDTVFLFAVWERWAEIVFVRCVVEVVRYGVFVRRVLAVVLIWCFFFAVC